MKWHRKRRKKYFKKIKRTYFLIIVWLLGLITLIALVLNSFLFEAQKKERLSKVKDYTDYTLIYQVQNRCELRERLNYKDNTYYFDCIDHIYLEYGTTKIPLEEIIEKELLTIEDMTKKMVREKEENQRVIYKMEETKNQLGYYLIIKEKEDHGFIVTWKPVK